MRASRPWHLAALLVVCGCSTPPPRPGPAPLASPPVASAPLPSPAASSAPASASAALAAPVASAPPPARKGCAQASPRKAAEVPWARLLTPGACVELVNRVQGPPNPDDVLLVETTEVRRLGKADVARLRFTRVLEGKPSDATPSELMSPLIAVTRGGVYLLPPEASDDDIQRALRQPPALALGASDGRPTARNGHTFALHPRTRGGPAACLARDVPREQNNCEDTCTGMVCLSPEGGVIILEGVAAPSFGSFIQDGYDIPPPTPSMTSKILPIDIWSDVVCPWCYIGKRRLEAALARFDERDATRITWHAFELDPSAPRSYSDGSTMASRLARKYGRTAAAAQAMIDQVTQVAAGDGLTFHLDDARTGNTFDAHRLLSLASERGKQSELKERFLRAYFTERQPIGDRETLAKLAAEVGLDEAEARAMLESDAHAQRVREDQAAARTMGASGVPFFVIGRKYAIGGAQPAEVLLRALQRAWSEGLAVPVEQGQSCDVDGVC